MIETCIKFIKKHSTKFILSILLILSLLFSLRIPSYIVDPRRNILAISQQIQSAGTYRATNGFLHINTRDDYVLTYYAGLDNQHSGVEYVTVSRLGGQYYVDLIRGAGRDQVQLLQGSDANEFIKQHRIPIEAIEDRITQYQSKLDSTEH